MDQQTIPDKQLVHQLREQAAEMHEKDSAFRANSWFDTLLMLLFALLVALSINQFIFEMIRVEGSSMEPTFYTGERVFSEKMSYMFSSPKRGDVVIVHYPYSDTTKMIKRVIGLPGETVEIREGAFYIDGELLDESNYWSDIIETHYYMDPVVVPDNSVFVVGDNRNHSSDSRDVGPIPMSRVVAHSQFVVWPISKFGSFKK